MAVDVSVLMVAVGIIAIMETVPKRAR